MALPEALAEWVEAEEQARLEAEALARLDCRVYLNPALDPADFGIGMIGVGRIANQRQIPAYRNAGLHVVAVADLKEEVLRGTQQRWGIRQGFRDYHDLLALEEVRVVDVLTNSFPRKQIILDAIAAGKHVISEKPFVRFYADGLEMVEAAERGGVKLAVHQPTRCYYPFAMMKVLIERGAVGEPFFIVDEMYDNQDRFYYENPVTRWHAELDDHLHVEWGAHHFDLVRHLSGLNPTLVYGSGTRMPGQHFKSEMASVYAVEFPGPLRAALVLTQVIQSGQRGWTVRVDGTEGSLYAPWISNTLELHSRRLKQSPYVFHWDTYESIVGINGRVGGHGAHMVDLINAVFEGREPISSGRDNLETVKVYLAAVRSAQEHRPVSPAEISPPPGQ